MTYIESLLLMTYDQCVDSLLKKYGSVKKDYFINKECKSANASIKRSKEGLFIHHIDEDKAIMLCTKEFAINNPFEYQKADRLVYCDFLEHLVLHIKIVEYPNPKKNILENCGVGGIYNFIVPDLNDIYSGIIYKQEWKIKAANNVINRKDDYFKCIKKLVDMNFDYPLLTTFNEKYGLWSNEKNEKIYDELKLLGVKY
ncbi:MAG: hypothetical protein RSA40_02765 [Malacoplasma sp.]